MYNIDQWKVMKVLGSKLPKRECFKIKDIKNAAFKNAPNDRVVRNAIRKPRDEGHVEIEERGEYRLTPKGVTFVQKAEKDGFKPSPVREIKKTAKPKKAVKKDIKKVAKKAKAANGKSVKAKKPVKVHETKAAEKPVAKKPAARLPKPKTEPKSEEKKADAPTGNGSTLTF